MNTDKQIAQQKIAEDFWLENLKHISYCQLFTFKDQLEPVPHSLICKLSEDTNASLATVSKGDAKNLLLLWAAALMTQHAYYTRQQDIVLRCPAILAGFTPGVPLPAMYLRLLMDEKDTFNTVLEKLQTLFKNAFRYRSYNEAAFLQRFESLHTGDAAALTQLHLSIEELQDIGQEPHKGLHIRIKSNGTLQISFDSNQFDKRLVEQYGQHLEVTMRQLLTDRQQEVSRLQLLQKEQLTHIIHTFNDTDVNIPPEQTVADLFEEICHRFPEKTAISCLSGNTSFRQLKTYADSIAHHLLHQQITTGSLIAIVLDRSEFVPAAMLGILKAGAVYLPIDPEYPQERIHYLVQNSRCSLVITEAKYMHWFDKAQCLDVAALCTMNDTPSVNLAKQEQIAYVIYTSGSTGFPKGAMITHKGLLNHVTWFNRQFAVNENDSTLLVTSYSFDGSVTYIWSCLTTGATLHILPKEKVIVPDFMLEYITACKVSFLKMVPSLFAALVSSPAFTEQPYMASVRFIKLGGEAIIMPYVIRYLELYPACVLANHYGLTETAVGSAIRIITSNSVKEFARLPVIGAPFDNCRIYILGHDRQPLPIGVTGEIYLGGIGVAKGYLNNPELTSERFISNPFVSGEHMYKTGDCGFWSFDGTIVYKGRIDDQVKIRGHRVELGEIEYVLRQHPAVEEGVVLYIEDDEQKLLKAFLKTTADPDVQELRAFMKSHLPEYMIPQWFIRINAVPLTNNGKIDRKALAGLKDTKGGNADYQPPRTEAEIALVNAFAKVLRKDRIGMKDDFFQLGGDSIKAILIISLLRREQYALTIRDIISCPVLEILATRMTRRTDSETSTPETGEVPLGPVQQAFLNDIQVNHSIFNQSMMLSASGKIDPETLEKLLTILVNHHDGLRMIFTCEAGKWKQDVTAPIPAFTITRFDITPYEDEAAAIITCCDELQHGFDLQRGPLLKVALIQGIDKDRVFLIAHHLIIDGVSWRIFLDDLSFLYAEYQVGRVLELPSKTTSFRKWQETLQNYAASHLLKKDINYWNQLKTYRPETLPVDFPQGIYLQGNEAVVSGQLDTVMTDLLKYRCYTAYSTNANDLLAAALMLAVKDVFGRDKLVLQLEGHGREDIDEHTDLSRTIGWFTVKYPVLLDITGTATLTEVLVKIKDTLHSIPQNGIGYGLMQHFNTPADNPGADVNFNFHGEINSNATNAGASFFTITQEYRPRFRDAADRMTVNLNLSGMIVDGVLHISLAYSTEQYRASTVEILLDTLISYLKMFIDMLSPLTKRHLTTSDLSFKQLSASQLALLNKNGLLKDVYQLTPMQEGLYFYWKMQPALYYQHLSLRLEGKLDIALLKNCYISLLERYDILRTTFSDIHEQELLQVVQTNVIPDIQYEDLQDRQLTVEEINKFQETCKLSRKKEGIHLGNDTLMKLTIFRYAEAHYGIIWSWHHIILDGWSIAILMHELFRHYDALTRNETYELPPVKQYGEYVKWLQQTDQEAGIHYWREYLAGYRLPATLPFLELRGAEAEYKFAEKYLLLDTSLTSAIKSFCTTAGVTESTFFQTVWGVLLSVYNNTRDVVFGAVVSGRQAELPGMEQMIGLFINTIPVRINYKRHQSFRELVTIVQESAADGMSRHHLSLAAIQSEHPLKEKLLDHLLIFENYPVATDEGGERSFVVHSTSDKWQNQTNYNFNILVYPSDTNFNIAFTFNRTICSEASIDKAFEHMVDIMRSVLEKPGNSLDRFRFLAGSERLSRKIRQEDLEEMF